MQGGLTVNNDKKGKLNGVNEKGWFFVKL